MRKFILFATILFSFNASAATTYFSCTVIEPLSKAGKTVKVTVKFAVKNYDAWKSEGELLQYPGADEDQGAILVEPVETEGGKHMTMMSNLNGQGGDLRVERTQLRLWGDGAGYQFTELVIWDADDEERTVLEGYVRDYGPAYNGDINFKQFIKCQRSNKKL